MSSTRGEKEIPRSLLRRKEASRYIETTWGIPASPQSLAKWAVIGGGPLYRLAGRFPLYDASDIDAWANGKLGPKQRSTSDNRPPLAHDTLARKKTAQVPIAEGPHRRTRSQRVIGDGSGRSRFLRRIGCVGASPPMLGGRRGE